MKLSDSEESGADVSELGGAEAEGSLGPQYDEDGFEQWENEMLEPLPEGAKDDGLELPPDVARDLLMGGSSSSVHPKKRQRLDRETQDATPESSSGKGVVVVVNDDD